MGVDVRVNFDCLFLLQETFEGIRSFSPHTKSVENTPETPQSKGPHIVWDEIRAAGDGFFTGDFNKAQIVRGPQTSTLPSAPSFLHSRD